MILMTPVHDGEHQGGPQHERRSGERCFARIQDKSPLRRTAESPVRKNVWADGWFSRYQKMTWPNRMAWSIHSVSAVRSCSSERLTRETELADGMAPSYSVFGPNGQLVWVEVHEISAVLPVSVIRIQNALKAQRPTSATGDSRPPDARTAVRKSSMHNHPQRPDTPAWPSRKR